MKTSRSTLRKARRIWGKLSASAVSTLTQMVEVYGICIENGELQLLNDRWYVTHTGLLGIARRNRCAGIDARPLTRFCDPKANRWAFKATVYKTRTCRGFVGYGDADPSNVSPQVRGAEMRVAETRAVNRALRKAYGIGICSVEEIGSFPAPPNSPAQSQRSMKSQPANGNHHPLRDRLCLLIRKHGLDGNLVKAYAAQFCDVSELRQASREQIASFIKHLAEYAERDRDGLLGQLNSYAPKPVTSIVEQAQAGEQKVESA